MTILENTLFLDKKESSSTKCNGRVFKCVVNTYLSKNGSYVENTSMVPQKRKSCPGCENCWWLDDALPEQIACDQVLLPSPIEHLEYYYLAVVNETKDWETGTVDGYDLQFIKV